MRSIFNQCGATKGLVTSLPAGVTCQMNNQDSTCVSTFPIGTEVTLTGMPLDDAFTTTIFKGFSGTCSGNPKCTFKITGDTTVTGTFCGLIP